MPATVARDRGCRSRHQTRSTQADATKPLEASKGIKMLEQEVRVLRREAASAGSSSRRSKVYDSTPPPHCGECSGHRAGAVRRVRTRRAGGTRSGTRRNKFGIRFFAVHSSNASNRASVFTARPNSTHRFPRRWAIRSAAGIPAIRRAVVKTIGLQQRLRDVGRAAVPGKARAQLPVEIAFDPTLFSSTMYWY